MSRNRIRLFYIALALLMLSACGRGQEKPNTTTEHVEVDAQSTEELILKEENSTEFTEENLTTETDITASEEAAPLPEAPTPEVQAPAVDAQRPQTSTAESVKPAPEVTTPAPEETNPVPETPTPEPEPEIPAPLPEEDNTSHLIPIPEEWNLIVVNRWNRIPDGYTPELVEVLNSQKVDVRIHIPLIEMFQGAERDNVFLIIREGYRSTEDQQRILDERVQSYIDQGYSQADAEAMARKWVAEPGTSEHELGLAVDINANQAKHNNMVAYNWLRKNAYKYGFILRYPKGKESITGIEYEQWHYRYVGKEVARILYESGNCLEEYLLSR